MRERQAVPIAMISILTDDNYDDLFLMKKQRKKMLKLE